MPLSETHPLKRSGDLAGRRVIPLRVLLRVAFRFMFILSLLVILINLDRFGIKGNPIEKFLLLLTFLIASIRIFPPKPTAYLFIMMVGVTILTGLASAYDGFSWKLYISGLFSLVAVAMVLVTRLDREDTFFVMKVFLYLATASILVGLLLQLGGVTAIIRRDFLGVARLAGSVDAAYFGPAAGTGVLAALFLADRTRKPGYLAWGALNGAFMLLSGGRMAAAVTIINAFFLFYFGFRRRIAFKLSLTYAGLLVALPIALYLAVGLLSRFESDSLSGRDLLWDYFQLIADFYEPYGVGLGHQYTLIDEQLQALTKTVATHNEYLRLRLELGMPASIFVLLALGLMPLSVLFYLRNVNIPAYLSGIATMYVFCLTDNVLSATLVFTQFWVMFLASVYHPPAGPRATAVGGRPTPMASSWRRRRSVERPPLIWKEKISSAVPAKPS